MIKNFLTILIMLFASNTVSAGSFSEIFGSEGARGVANSKTRSLSYSLQYLAFSGVSGLLIKKMHNDGFLEPLGFTPESYKKMSPLAYDNPSYFNKTKQILKNNTDSINEFNSLYDSQKVTFKRSPSLKSMASRRNDSFNKFIFEQDKREILINQYYDKN